VPSFDVVSEIDLQEVDNALNTTRKEIGTRYDFKGSKASIERKDHELILLAEDEYKLGQMLDLLAAPPLKVAFASPASALASSVLPVPGGP